jgi:hypothetical protein
MLISVVADRRIYHYFEEYIESIFYWMKKKDIQTHLIFTEDADLYGKIDSSNYIFCLQTLNIHIDKIKDPLKRILVINTEQNTRKTQYYNHILNLLHNGLKIMDYHLGNIEFINKETNNQFINQIFYLPYLYCSNDKVLLKKKRTKDVCFVGLLTPYRYQIIEQISKKIKIDNIGFFGAHRDNILSNYKILLNLSADPSYQVFETIRCYRLVFNKIIVISEEKEIKENNIVDSCIIFAKKEDLQNTLDYVLKNYDKVLKEKYDGKDKDFMEWSEKNFNEFMKKLSNS